MSLEYKNWTKRSSCPAGAFVHNGERSWIVGVRADLPIKDLSKLLINTVQLSMYTMRERAGQAIGFKGALSLTWPPY